MPRVTVLGATEHRGWLEQLSSLPGEVRDVYFTPEYVSLHCFVPGTRPLMFAYVNGEYSWVYPFLLQPLTRIGNHDLAVTRYDIESQYGYGGPIANSADPGFIEEAVGAFRSWCRSLGVIAEFVRFHPLIDNRRFAGAAAGVEFDRETVSLALTAHGHAAFPDPQARYLVRRAERAGVVVSETAMKENLEAFTSLYLRTMSHIKADAYYLFDNDYFSGLAGLVARDGVLLSAVRDGTWIGAAVFLKSRSFFHYHLSATDPDRRIPGVTNLILARAAEIGFRLGLARLHLGGGRSRAADDSLLRFKKSVGDATHEFHIMRRIHDADAYAETRNLWEKEFPELVSRVGHRLLCYRTGRSAG